MRKIKRSDPTAACFIQVRQWRIKNVNYIERDYKNQSHNENNNDVYENNNNDNDFDIDIDNASSSTTSCTSTTRYLCSTISRAR